MMTKAQKHEQDKARRRARLARKQRDRRRAAR